jgi:hypothetical protein
MSYTAKVHKSGPDTLTVESGGKIDIVSGGQITDDGTQASAIADATAISGGESPTEAEHTTVITKLNSVLAALRGVGIIAAS